MAALLNNSRFKQSQPAPVAGFLFLPLTCVVPAIQLLNHDLALSQAMIDTGACVIAIGHEFEPVDSRTGPALLFWPLVGYSRRPRKSRQSMMLRIVRSFRGIVTAMIVLAVMHPANAQIVSTTLSANQPSYTGYCPTTVSFSGLITGKPGTTFRYNFAWLAGKVLSGDFMATMPTSGSLPVQYSITVPESSTDSMQIWVKNILGGQPNVYSNSAAYSVACKFNPAVLPPPITTFQKPITLHPQWFALREYEYKTVGPFSTFIPERGSARCPDLCIGWDHILNGSFLWLFHWNTYDRAFWGYDPAAFKGLKVTKAIVTLTVDGGDPACYGGLGRAVLSRTPVVKGSTQTFNAPYPDDGDFNWPAPIQFTAGSATITVTNIVQAWVNGKIPNQGFVLRGKLEDNGSNGNDSCSLSFGRDAVLTIE